MGKEGGAPQQTGAKKLTNLATNANKDMADYQTYLNRVNQQTPYGSLTYSATEDEDGNPIWTATQELSKKGQKLFDKNMNLQNRSLNLADRAMDQFKRQGKLDLGGKFKANTLLQNKDPSLKAFQGYDEFNAPRVRNYEDFQAPQFDANSVESRLIELGQSRLDPLLDKRREQLEQSLLDRGIAPGSTAYSNAQMDQLRGENDALNQLILNGRSQAMDEQNQAYDQALGAHQQNFDQFADTRNARFNQGLASHVQNYTQAADTYNTNFAGALAKYGQNFQERLAKRGQRTNDELLKRQTPLNEYLALSGVSAPDVAGIYNNDYAQRYNAWQNQRNATNQMLGGLFSAGAGLLGF